MQVVTILGSNSGNKRQEHNNPLHKGPFQKGKRKKVHGNDGDRHRIDDA